MQLATITRSQKPILLNMSDPGNACFPGILEAVAIGINPNAIANAGEGDEADADHLSSAVGLIWRALVMWMLLAGVVTIAHSLG